MQVPYKGEFLMRPVGRNEVPFLVEPLARASMWLNDWVGFTSAEQLERNHPAVQKKIRHLKDKGCYVDLRRVFEHQSIAFLTLTSSALYYLSRQFVSQGLAVLVVVLSQAVVFYFCTMW
jgi:hypothetical protein